MKSKDEIIKILTESLDSVYCDTCKNDTSDNCDYCHRKAMGWGISEKFAGKIADEILKN